MGCLRQLRLLLWKNWLQQRRSKWFTIFEVIVPCLLIALCLGLMAWIAGIYERANPESRYTAWEVTGTQIDLLTPTALGYSNETIIPPSYLTDYDKEKCKTVNLTTSDGTSFNLDLLFAYTPNTVSVQNIMFKLVFDYQGTVDFQNYPLLKSIYNDSFLSNVYLWVQPDKIGFDTEEEMVSYMQDQYKSKCNNPLFAGIVFDFPDNIRDANEMNLKYKIRMPSTIRRFKRGDEDVNWDISTLFARTVETGPHNPFDNDGGLPGYWRSGFLSLQKAVDSAISDYLIRDARMNGLITTPDFRKLAYKVEIVRFPFPKYSTKIIKMAAMMLPVIVPLCYLMSVIYIVRAVVMEKEDRLKEYMRVMGLSQFMNWLAHFIISFAKLLISIFVMVFFLHLLAPNSSSTLLFLFLVLYAFNVVYVAFLVSTFMNTATVATMLAIVVWVMLYAWATWVVALWREDELSMTVGLLNCVNPNIALMIGFDLMAIYEMQANGLTWKKVFTRPSPSIQMTFAHTLVAMLVDLIILIVLTWYVEAVYPGGDGVPQKPWFFVLKSYWFPFSVRKAEPISSDSSQQESHVEIEEVSDDLKPSINIVNLTKTYGTSIFKKLSNCKFDKSGEKTAVSNLNFKIYPNQCTVLLGHNGAGKSTTFSILTGVAAPTKGTVYVNEMDIRTSLPKIRKQMGLCPQYNTLFSFLTVMEHLEFFAKLKGRVWDPQEASQILDRLRIAFKAHEKAGTMSGGQKRKLSLAIALIGGSEIVMLDEPTSGMDPGARHETWTLLQQEKTRRTILLSTHFMEEADLLGDRIAVVAHGQLECCGSSMFLKKAFGDGYHLTIVYSMTTKTDVALTTSIIRKFIADAEIYSHIGQEATYLLASKHRPTFPKLFHELEQNQTKCGITSFGTSITTLEEVFLKVNDLAETRYNEANGLSEKNELIGKDDPQLKQLSAPTRLTGASLQFQHAKAMIFKRFIYLYRTWLQYLPIFVFPIVYLLLILSSMTPSTTRTVKSQDSLTISFGLFSGTTRHVISGDGNFNGSKLSQLLEDGKKGFGFDSLDVENDVEKFIMDKTEKEGQRLFGLSYPIAFSTNSTTNGTLRAHFNNFGLFTPALALSLADSLMLSKIMKKQYRFTVTNHPLPSSSEETTKTRKSDSSSLTHGLSVAFGVVVAGYATFLIMERKKKAKHMQFLSGVRPWMFWLCAFLFDFLLFLIQIVFFIVLFYIFQLKPFTHEFKVMMSILLSMIVYGWAAIPATYFFQFFFESAPKGFALIAVYHILSQIIGMIVMTTLQIWKPQDEALSWSIAVMMFFPTYTLTNIIERTYNNEVTKMACEELDCNRPLFKSNPCCLSGSDRSYVDNVMTVGGNKGTQMCLVILFCEGLLFWACVMIKEFELIGRLAGIVKKGSRKKPEKTSMEQFVQEDSDVLEEKKLVQTLKKKKSALLVCDNLVKRYGRFNAVKGVNFHVNAKNCFGLLGVNGAGKTSTFQMLTGENRITSGDAYVNSWSVKSNWRKAGSHIGYCPQYDAIIKELSGEETLYMYARIRGIPANEIPTRVNAVIHSIGIGMYAKKRIETYSGGNKRRLSLGIALIGLPSVLLLDEPTSGVDPKARRIVWNILNQVRDLGTALVLTSHSMDECEALCTELAIMIYGKFRCYGSCQHIKSRYGSGYTLLVRLKGKSGVDRTKDVVTKTFPGCKLTEEHILQLNYDIPRGQYTWSQLFAQLETISQQLNWDDYSLSQTTLEQVFVEFSRAAAAPPS